MRECPFNVGSYRAEESLVHSAAGVMYRARGSTWQGGAPHYAGLFLLEPEAARDGVVLNRFRDGIERSVGLSHPNLMQVLEFGEAKGETYVVTDWLPGRPIERFSGHLRSRSRPWPVAQTICVAIEIAEALSFLHSYRDPLSGSLVQLNHGYVRPKSIMLTYGGVVKLVPLPIAWAEAQAERAHIPDVIYSAPEQVLGWEIDSRSDLFSLGVVLWEMLTGALLFQAPDMEERKRLLFELPIDRPSAREASVPPELDKVVLRLLDRDPYLRYQVAEEVIRDLKAVLKFRFGPDALGELATFCQEEFRELREKDLSGIEKVSQAESETRVLDVGGSAEPGGSRSDALTNPEIPAPAGQALRGASNPGQRSEKITVDRAALVVRPGDTHTPGAWAQTYTRQEEFDWGRTAVVAVVLVLVMVAMGLGLRRAKLGIKAHKTAPASVAVEPAQKMGKALFVTEEDGFSVEVDGAPVSLSDEFEIPVPIGIPVYIRVQKPGYEDIVVDRIFRNKEDFLIELNFKKSVTVPPAKEAQGGGQG